MRLSIGKWHAEGSASRTLIELASVRTLEEIKRKAEDMARESGILDIM